MVSRMWFCISCRSVSCTVTVLDFAHSCPPLLARTTSCAVVASGGGAVLSNKGSPSLTPHSCPLASTRSRVPPATNTCGWPSLNRRAIPLDPGSTS